MLLIGSLSLGVPGCTCVLLLNGLFGVGMVCCLCFGAGVFLFFCLVSRVEFLWLLSCGWFVALRSLVGGVVALLHCFHYAWLVVFCCISCLLQYLFWVHYCELRYFLCYTHVSLSCLCLLSVWCVSPRYPTLISVLSLINVKCLEKDFCKMYTIKHRTATGYWLYTLPVQSHQAVSVLTVLRS